MDNPRCMFSSDDSRVILVAITIFVFLFVTTFCCWLEFILLAMLEIQPLVGS